MRRARSAGRRRRGAAGASTSISIVGQLSSPSDAAPSSEPIASSASTVSTSRRPAWRRAMPSSSRSSSNGSIRTFESEPMHMPIPRWRTRSTGRKPSPRFASVVGHTQMRAPACPSRSSSRPSACVPCTTVVRGPRQPHLGEQLDRAQPVLREALLDLARLLVRVHVQWQAVRLARTRRAPRASRAGRRARSGGRRRRARRPRGAPRARAGSRRRRLPEPVDARRARRRRRGARARRPPRRAASAARVRLRQPEVVELADRGVTGGAHLPVDPGIALADPSRVCHRPGPAWTPARPRSPRPRSGRAGAVGTRGCGR